MIVEKAEEGRKDKSMDSGEVAVAQNKEEYMGEEEDLPKSPVGKDFWRIRGSGSPVCHNQRVVTLPILNHANLHP